MDEHPHPTKEAPNMLMLTKSLVAFTILAAAGNAAAQAPAAETVAPTAVVSFADLDIGSPAGLRALNGRIYRAASTLCIQQGTRSLQTELAGRRCMSAAMSGAQAGIDQVLAERSVHLASRSKTQHSGR
jgi:UrcA family protein